MRIRARIALATATAALVTATGGAGAAARPEFFSPTSVWNRPLNPRAGIATHSAAMVVELVRQMDAYGGPWMNVESFSIPVYRVGPKVPRVRVALDHAVTQRKGSTFRWSSVPVPANARPAAGTDGHIVILQPSTDTMWEFWQFHGDPATGYTAAAGARILNESRSPGIIEAPYGATASGLPAAAGIVTARDMRRGVIDHALAIAVPEPLRERLTLPATRTDGWSTNPDAPMEGSRFRLDPKLDIASLHLHPFVRMLAVAAQRYGIIVRDKAGALTLYGQDPINLAADPFTAMLGDADRKALLRTFPWDRLQELPGHQFCCWQNWTWRAPKIRVPARRG